LLLKITFMNTTASSFPPILPEETSEVGASAARASLAAIPPGGAVLVTAVILEADLAAWVRAVGIREGERLVVLRRAAFGGPIHVRTQAGGEFALARSVARAVLVRTASTP
jgi:ferrous iron transport protein A